MASIRDLKELLDLKCTSSNQIIITMHIGADLDAISSSLALYEALKQYNKPIYILNNDNLAKIQYGVKKIINETINKYKYITSEDYNSIKTNNDLLITVDTNTKPLISCGKYLNEFKSIIIIDHHKEDKNTLKTNYKFMDDSFSSAAEIISNLIFYTKTILDKDILNYLLAGIYLDTNKYTKNCSAKTMKTVSELIKRGADASIVNSFFEMDFESDRKVQNLVNKAKFFTYTIALCIADDSVVYTREELAKVADYLLKFKVDAAFASGLIDDELISISARSKGKIDVSEIMNALNGGGTIYSAATKIESKDLDSAEKRLEKIIIPKFYIKEN